MKTCSRSSMRCLAKTGLLSAYLGYANPLRLCSRELRRLTLASERRQAIDAVPLAARYRRTYVHRPLGERAETTTFFGKRAVLSCTVSTSHGMYCSHVQAGATYAADLPHQSGPPCVVESAHGCLFLVARTFVARFEAQAAAILYFDDGDDDDGDDDDDSRRHPTRLGDTLHLRGSGRPNPPDRTVYMTGRSTE